MDKQKKSPAFLWDENAQVEDRPLRRPHRSSLDNSLKNNSSTDTVVTQPDILSTSKLSAEAKEWFPPNYNQPLTPSQPKSVNERLSRIRSGTPASQAQTENPIEFNQDLLTLQEILLTLNADPAQFHTLMDTFIETMTPFYEDPAFVADATKIIFEQGLNYPNLRYNAAKLCSILEEQCALFVPYLHMICEKTYNEKTVNADLALFLAELYNQLKRQEAYGPLLMNVLNCIISLGTNDSIKAVCQVLKLTGYALEQSNKHGVDTIFTNLEALKPSLSSNVLALVNSVKTLRSSNWGHSQNSPSPTNNRLTNTNTKIGNESVFYGPDGLELTEEEKQFMFENCDNSSNGDDSDEWEPNPEMDEEMQAAFQEFIKMR